MNHFHVGNNNNDYNDKDYSNNHDNKNTSGSFDKSNDKYPLFISILKGDKKSCVMLGTFLTPNKWK